MITPVAKRLIERVVNVFETGAPDGKYDLLVIYPDGKNGSRQITYGRSQTTEQGNLSKLLMLYIQKGGTFADRFAQYMDRVGKKPLVDNPAFKSLLKTAAQQDPIMKSSQDEFFDLVYYLPALQFFERNAFALPLSLLVIYDSYIHSGAVPGFLRKRFGEFPPASGGDEKMWTTSYVDIRHQWLKYHTNPLLQKTIYRTQCFKNQIDGANWNLTNLPIMANGVGVS